MKKIKVALLIDEFFGGANTAYGGYGFLAREYICKYIPNNKIQIDVLLERKQGLTEAELEIVDNTHVYRLPYDENLAKDWLKKQNYDLFMSIEMTYPSYEIMKLVENKKLLLWIQDPRPNELWQEKRNTVSLIKDPCITDEKIPLLIKKMSIENRISFISQGYSLNKKAFMLYNLPEKYPVKYTPNPIDFDQNYEFDINKKKKQVIFLGRLEAQKRAWLFCEVAKRMPEYEFYVMGKFFRDEENNKKPLEQYINGNIPNLHFTGHLEGDEKNKLIRESRMLLNTSIWEGIPISWLEAMQYGTAIVSCLDNESIPSRFGKYVGEILGNGYDKVDLFIPAIKELMENDELYSEKAFQAINCIKSNHNITDFKINLRKIINKNVKFNFKDFYRKNIAKYYLSKPYTIIKTTNKGYKFISQNKNIKVLSNKNNYNNIIEINEKTKNIKLNFTFYKNSSNNYIKFAPSNNYIKTSFNYWGNKSIISIGQDFSCGGAVFNLLDSNCAVYIGSNVMCASNINFIPSDAHSIFSKDTWQLLNFNKPIVIGNNVWIATDVNILKGSQIANNNIVGTGSVVTKKFDEENTVIAGNPAKVIKRNVIWERKSPSQTYNTF